MEPKEAFNLMVGPLQTLMRHFTAVRIVATHYDPTTGTTLNVSSGDGPYPFQRCALEEYFHGQMDNYPMEDET